jgi:t-SNARE complex subunit (syntaxin)
MYTRQDYGRLSLQNALTKGDYIGAFEKVNDYIKMIDIGLSQIAQYGSKINSKNEKENISEKTNELIKSTTQNIIDALNYINDIKKFNYSSNIQRNENINKANNLERNILSKKNKLQKIIDEIKNSGEKYINNARNSLRIIQEQEQERESSLDNLKINNGNNDHQSMEMKLMNERDNIVEDIEEKQKLINYCAESINQINEITKFQNEKILEAGEKIDSIEDNILQMSSNISNAVAHMNQAKKYQEEAGGYSNYCLYIIGGIVCLLILLVLIMPSS